MKKILLAISTALVMGSAMAHDTGFRHGHDRDGDGYRDRGHMRHDRQVMIPDRVERKYVIRDNGRRILVTTTYRCTDQRRGQCTMWTKVGVDRDVVRRGYN